MIEKVVEIMSWITVIILFYFLVPKSKYREALLGFLIMQAITWPLGCIVVEYKLIKYPVHLFGDSYKASYTFEYFVYPMISGIFNTRYPKSSTLFRKVMYTSFVVSSITFWEVILEKFTDSIEYLHWDWYMSWITLFITLHISYWCSNWFFKKN